MKNNKRLWLAATLLAMLLALSMVFCSCKPQDPQDPIDTTEAPSDETTAEPLPESYDLVKNGEIKIVRVVRPTNDSSTATPEVTAAKLIRDTINSVVTDRFGITLEYSDTLMLEEDFLMPGQSYDSSTLEILVGATAYEESNGIFEGLGYGDYLVKPVGNKIVVAAYTTSGYTAAANRLVDLIIDGTDTETKSVTLKAEDLTFSATSAKRISAIPTYEGGIFNSYYKAGNSVDEIIIKKTSMDEFDKYLTKLTDAGYTCSTTNSVSSSKFATYRNADYTLTVGYYDYESSARLIIEPLTDPIATAPQSYQKVTTSQITMLGLEYQKSDGSYSSNGLSLLIRLEDGSFIVVDGGFNRAECASNLYKEIREQAKEYETNSKNIRIAAWIITHAHGDHSGMIAGRSDTFKTMKVENFLVNFISDTEREKAMSTYKDNWTSGEGGGYSNVYTAASALGAKVRTVHVGEVYYFADAKLEIMYTIESFGPQTCNAFNTTSLIIKATIQDTAIMITGDATGNAMQAATQTFGDHLKSDIVTLAHHGYTTWGNNGGVEMAYRKMLPSTVLWPQGGMGYPNYKTKSYNLVVTDTKSNPNFQEVYVAGTSGDTIILPLPYTVGTAVINRTAVSKMTGAATTKAS